MEENLQRLRSRGLGRKRSLTLREFALGIEAVERFSRAEPLRRVHECVFEVLALESEPVDPRLRDAWNRMQKQCGFHTQHSPGCGLSTTTPH